MRKTLLITLLGLSAAAPLTGCVPAAVVAGAGAGALVAEDRRTPGTYLMDTEIELKASGLVMDQKFEGVHVNFNSFNRRVLVSGEATSPELKAKVLEIAKGVGNVREVIDAVVLAQPAGIGAISNDTLITAKVKARFIEDTRFSANQIKVVTENCTVYLMGLATRAEGAAAAEVASRTSGVARVVKVFEYLD